MAVGINVACELPIIARLQLFDVRPCNHQNIMRTFANGEMSLMAYWYV